jgi:hypothetical protein
MSEYTEYKWYSERLKLSYFMEQILSEEPSSCKTGGSHNSVNEDSSLWEYEFSIDKWLLLANDKALYPRKLESSS